MEPVSAIALSLALGAGAVTGKALVESTVKDAYEKLKGLITSRYPSVSVEQLEQAPESKSRRAVVEEDLAKSKAPQDAELVAAAQALAQLIQSKAPTAATVIGVDLKDVTAVNLKLSDIVASGTGVKLDGGSFSGDMEIHGVRAGVNTVAPDSDDTKKDEIPEQLSDQRGSGTHSRLGPLRPATLFCRT